jgi:glycosyltransferase involved in cell wall biosynthesis
MKADYFESELNCGLFLADSTSRILNYDLYNLALNREDWSSFGCVSMVLLDGATHDQLTRFLVSLRQVFPGFCGELILSDSTKTSEVEKELNLWGVSPIYVRQIEDQDFRDKAIEYSSRKWILYLDPRMTIVWNPLVICKDEALTTGSPVINLPRITREGVLVSIDSIRLESTSDGLWVVGESKALSHARKQNVRTPPICTGIDSASLFIRKDVLELAGGFGNRVHKWAGDLFLASQLWQNGIKPVISMAESIFDDELHSSGFDKLRLSGPATESDEDASRFYNIDRGYHSSSVTISRKSRVALIIDIYGWAFDNIANRIKEHLSESYDFKIIPIGYLEESIHVWLLAEDCDIIHFFWREDLLQIGNMQQRESARALGFEWEEFESRYIKNKKISTSIYDHLFQESDEIEARVEIYRGISGYTVANSRLFRFYSSMPDIFPRPTCIVEDGVSLEIFRPTDLERFRFSSCQTLTVGWVGNSTWANNEIDFKGLHTILRPAIEELQSEGYAIRLELADRQKGFIPHSLMPLFYNGIHILACTSLIEGTPNPILEAMACGVPVVTTDVGVIREVFGDEQMKLILEERSISCLKETLRSILEDVSILEKISNENLLSIEEWDWPKTVRAFDDFFRSVIGAKT